MCGKRLSYRMYACFATSLRTLCHSRHYFQLNETFLFLCFILLRLFHNQFSAEHRSNRMAVIVLSSMNHFDAKTAMTQGIAITSSQECSAQHECIEISLNRKCVWRWTSGTRRLAIEFSHAIYNFISHFNNWDFDCFSVQKSFGGTLSTTRWTTRVADHFVFRKI